MLVREYLNRDQRRVAEFLQAVALTREAASQVPGLAPVAGAGIELISYFIESELNHRQAERFDLLNLRVEAAGVHR